MLLAGVLLLGVMTCRACSLDDGRGGTAVAPALAAALIPIRGRDLSARALVRSPPRRRPAMNVTARARLPRTVIVLGGVSLLNDAASEMIAPLLPLLLTTTLGAGPAIVGLLEGVAQTTASVLKLLSGRWADRGVRPRRLIFAGYGLSNLARPLIGLARRLGHRARPALSRSRREGHAHDAARRIGGRRRRRLAARAVPSACTAPWITPAPCSGPLIAAALLAAGARRARCSCARPCFGCVAHAADPLRAYRAHVSPHRPALAAPLRWRALDAPLRALLMAAALLALAGVPDAFLVLWAHDAGIAETSLAAAVGRRAPAAGARGRLGRHAVRPHRSPHFSRRRMGRACALAAAHDASAQYAPGMGSVRGLLRLHGAHRAGGSGTRRRSRAAWAACKRARAVSHVSAGVGALPGALLFGALWQWWSEPARFSRRRDRHGAGRHRLRQAGRGSTTAHCLTGVEASAARAADQCASARTSTDDIRVRRTVLYLLNHDPSLIPSLAQDGRVESMGRTDVSDVQQVASMCIEYVAYL